MVPAVTDSISRFSNRVSDYVRFRPSYPREILGLLARDCALSPESIVADIGSGTGILTRLFLDHGNTVFAVEPNAAMRAAAEKEFGANPRFRSIDGRAESTTLSNGRASIVSAGQAFHWFDPPRARAEFQRILAPGGWTALIWNERRLTGSPFLAAYEEFLQTWGVDYAQVAAAYPQFGHLEAFFHPSAMRSASFPNSQRFDFEGLRGRLLSASYAPPSGHPKHEPMIAALSRLFEEHREDGQVEIDYDCAVYYGRLE